MSEQKFYPLRGGLDLATPMVEMVPGHVIRADNYEPVERGYRRVDGHERFDGKPKPSAASYWVIDFDAGTAAVGAFAVLTGETSGATAKVLVGSKVRTGTYGASTAAGFIVLYQVTGTFLDNENLQVDAATRCVANGSAISKGTLDQDYILHFDAGTVLIVEDDIVTGATSAATGVALFDMTILTGTVDTSDAAGYLVLVALSGTFADNENLQVSAATRCVADGTTLQWFDDTVMWHGTDREWMRLAREYTRDAIGTVPGSGYQRGDWVFNGDTYAFRDNVDASAGQMFKGTSTGWALQALGSKVKFQTGTVEIVAGDTVTGATSAATGEVTRVALRTGSWSLGTAAGQLIFATITGTFSNGENLQVAAGTRAVANGASSAITLPAGGRYDFTNHNFSGASNLTRMYGCQGVGTAFEWDGTVFVPIETGMTTDTPDHIAEFKNHLFLSFPGGSIQNSGIGGPYAWTILTGASEFSMGHDVVGFLSGFAKSLIVFARNKIGELIGNDATDFSLDPIGEDAGAIEWTAQQIGTPIYLDNLGIRDLRATAAYGDFQMGTISNIVNTIFTDKKADGVSATASMRVRAKNQYWVFWDDDTALVCYLGRKRPEFMTVTLDNTVRCACSSEDSNGDEVIFFGSEDDYVYQFNKGISFDGQAVLAYVVLPYYHAGSPGQVKRFIKATLEADAVDRIAIKVGAEFCYSDFDHPPAVEEEHQVDGGAAHWGANNWDEFTWSSSVCGRAHYRFDGMGENISVRIVSEAFTEEPHTIHGIHHLFTYRRQFR
ncbi:MAG: hypothetical protein Q7S17_07785 [Xanthobacteraceae bacterium]|nr:hypothetical protein [Xanthobacteraceae bacterium]